MREEKVLAKMNRKSVEAWIYHFDSDNQFGYRYPMKASTHINKVAALNCLSDTCMPKRLYQVYIEYIYKVENDMQANKRKSAGLKSLAQVSE